MKPENIESIVIEYLKTENAQYALMLNGAWGTGKTFFWKDSLSPLVERQKFKSIYISLNGIKTIKTLQRQLFIKLIPYLDKGQSKTLKTARKLIGNTIGSLSKAIIKVDPSDLFQGIGIDSFNFSKKFICFDDLERCQIPIKEILGFINGLVEHKNLKCLILADEDKILNRDKKRKKHYYNTKEKIIGRTVNYNPDIENILPKLYVKYEKEAAFFTFIKDNQNFIRRIFDDQKEANIRTISFFIDSFRVIYKHVNIFDKELKKELLFLTAIISIEYKNGSLKSNESQDFKNLGNNSFLWYQIERLDQFKIKAVDKKEAPKKKKSYAETFCLKYLNNRLDNYHFYESVYTYILSGYLDEDKLINELEKRRPKTPTKEDEAFANLMGYNFRKFTNEKFISYTKDVLEFLEKGAYSIYNYEQLSIFYHFLVEKGLIKYTHDDIEEKLFTGIKIAFERKEIDHRFYDNLIHTRLNNPIAQPIRNKIVEFHNVLNIESVNLDSNQLIEVLAFEDYGKLHALFKDKKFNKEFIAYLDGNKLFSALKRSSNQYLTLFTNEMRERYNHNNITQFYPNDYSCLNTLLKSVQRHLKVNEPHILRKFLWEELKTVLTDTCSRLKKEES